MIWCRVGSRGAKRELGCTEGWARPKFHRSRYLKGVHHNTLVPLQVGLPGASAHGRLQTFREERGGCLGGGGVGGREEEEEKEEGRAGLSANHTRLGPRQLTKLHFTHLL